MKPISILVANISACLVGAGCDAGEYVEEEVVERSVEFQPGGRLSLVNVNGDISIGTWDRHEVTMKAEKRARAGSEEAARLLLEKTAVEFDRIENRIDIRTEVPEKPRRNRNVSTTYTLTVPEEIELELKSVNGSMQVNDVSGAVDAKTTNGRIGLAGITGAVQARTTNGNVDLSGVLGPIETNATNGNIEVAISEISEEAHDIRAATTNGGVEVTLPKGLKAHLKAYTANGNIDTDFPVAVKGGISKSVDGVINGGGRLIHLETVNGSIRLKEL